MNTPSERAQEELRHEAEIALDCNQVMDGIDPRAVLAALAQPSERAGWSRAELTALLKDHLPVTCGYNCEAAYEGVDAMYDDAATAIMALAPPSSLDGNQGVSPSRDHDLGAGSALKWRPLEYERPKGETFDQMRTEVWKGELYKRGDTILVWVNEGDLYLSKVMVPGGVKLPPADPTGSADSQSEEQTGPTVGAIIPSPPLADGEPETEDFGSDLSKTDRPGVDVGPLAPRHQGRAP